MVIAREREAPAGAAWPIEWRTSPLPVPYEEAVAAMEARIAAIRAGGAPELVWLLEHPSLYTAGTSARSADLVEPGLFPVHRSGRGGQYTYHGPGQRVAYVMLDLKRRGGEVRPHRPPRPDTVRRAVPGGRFAVRGRARAPVSCSASALTVA